MYWIANPDNAENYRGGTPFLKQIKHMKNNEAIIKEFLQKMVTQDNRSTAFPIFYVIRTEVEEPAPTDNCEFTKWYWQDETYDSLEEIRQYCEENEYSESEIDEAIREAYEYGIRKRWDKRGMFLTETDAENHLKLNHYHYSHNAHTYVEHAWRAPELTEFLSALINHFEIKKEKI